MKKIIFAATMSLLFVTTSYVFANDNGTKKELLADIKEETKKCAVQIISVSSESENVLNFESECSSLKILSSNEAQILIDGQWLTARITESGESDGGDLDDLAILNSEGKVLATKTNIPAYDSVVVAMAGDSDFKKIQKK
ncbi:MAG: hypothetical protein H7281_16975 [Bacteriovorax sp.]|nr:hypothetical protein [Bacteriovorax sp.]